MGTLTSLRGQIPPDNLTAYRTSRGSGTHWPQHRQKQKSFPGNLQFDVNSKTIRTRYNDRMAASVNRYLVCFYCNVKSRRKQDGTVRQWECSHCDAMNYLDEASRVPATDLDINTDLRRMAISPILLSQQVKTPRTYHLLKQSRRQSGQRHHLKTRYFAKHASKTSTYPGRR